MSFNYRRLDLRTKRGCPFTLVILSRNMDYLAQFMKATQPIPIAVFSSRFAIAGSRSVTCRQCRRSDLYHLSPGIILALVIAVVLGKSFAARAQTCTNAPSGLVAWYQGEGNANDSAGTANAIFFNPAYAAGEVGQAFSFNGTSGFAEIPVVPALNFTNNNPMSIEFWAYRTGTASTMELLGKRGSACGAIQYEISLTPGAGLAFDTSGGSVATGYQLPTNAWVHLAVSFDGTNILFYTNGILAATGTGQLGAANGAPVYLGTSSSCPGFVGLLDEISFYNRALAASEIQGIFAVGSAGKCPLPPVIVSQPQSQTVPAGTNATFTVVVAGASPLSYQWQFDSTNLAGATISSLTITNVRPSNTGYYSVVVSNAGGSVTSSNAILAIANCYADPPGLISWWPGEGNANDKFGTNNGILVGGVTFGPGEVGQAFQFNGASTQYVDVPTSASLNPTANLTLEAWIYPQLPLDPVSSPVIKKAGQGGLQQYGYTLEFSVTNGIRIIVYLNPGGSVASPIAPVAFNQWSHVAGVFDGTNVYIYVNGALAGITGAAGQIISSGNDLQLAHDPSNPSRFYNGLIDEASLYSTALSAAQIQGIYSAGVGGKCAPVPYFVVQPVNQTNFAGGSTSFAAAASGSSPLYYQWQFDGTNIPGATQTALTLINLQPANAGNYSVTASNALGFASSSNALLTLIIPVCAPAPSNLVSWWAAEGNANDNEGVNNGTLINGVTFAPGLAGQAFHMNGSAQYVKIPRSPSLLITNQITIDFWMNSDPSNPIGSAIEGLVTSDFYGLEIANSPGRVGINFFLSTNNGATYAISSDVNSGGITFPTGQWHHIAATYDGSKMQTYLDGQPYGFPRPVSGFISPMLTNSFITIGSEDGRYCSCSGRYYKGLIDEIDVFNRALSASEILAIYNGYDLGKCPFPPSLVTQPQNREIKPGSNVTFSASAAGSNPLGYQWTFDGSALPGATNSSLTLTNVQALNAGAYSLTASNSVGSATSSNAVLKVQIITVLGNGQVLSNAQYAFGGQVTIQLQNYYTNGDMFYTLDGSIPSFASTPYTGPFVVNQSAILQALAYDPDFVESGYSDPIMLSFIPVYMLTATTPGGGTILLNPTNPPYASNSVVGLTATASNGWAFLQWAGDASGTSLTNSVLMNTNKVVQALFGSTLSVTSSPGGSVLRSPSAALYPYGTSVQISALPQTNNFLALWGNAASGNLNPLYFALTNPNPTVSALFVGLGSNQVSLAVVPVGHGKVSIAPQANVFTNGQSVTITATAQTNHTFLGWSGDASGSQNPLTVLMTSSKTIYANFSKNYNFGFIPLTGQGLKTGFQLTLNGEIPVAYRFDASTNLSNWLPLITLTNYAGTLQYNDTNAANFNLRFYRGVPLP